MFGTEGRSNEGEKVKPSQNLLFLESGFQASGGINSIRGVKTKWKIRLDQLSIIHFFRRQY
jgi:hypothetical protein